MPATCYLSPATIQQKYMTLPATTCKSYILNFLSDIFSHASNVNGVTSTLSEGLSSQEGFMAMRSSSRRRESKSTGLTSQRFQSKNSIYALTECLSLTIMEFYQSQFPDQQRCISSRRYQELLNRKLNPVSSILQQDDITVYIYK